ncbi:hypothetical protein K438DRAFT_1754442 [Mycena galopus ATCC 62051]|nr:hypothetical protein K438DRAFT_1754442 [Mycena galopus ATCC 62051]
MAPKPKHGNPGYFHGESLTLLLERLPAYISTPSHKKDDFWTDFFPDWDTAYPGLKTEDEIQEWKDEEENYKAEVQAVKEHNAAEVKKKSRRKAIKQPLPFPGARLNELRARGAGKQKIKAWFSNAMTKQNVRKTEPFHAWLSKLTALQGAPRRIQLAWILWRHEKHGEALRNRYCDKFKGEADEEKEEGAAEVDGFEKDGDKEDEEDSPPVVELMNRKYDLAVEYYGELTEEEQEEIQKQREEDFQERRVAYQRTLRGETAYTADELAERRRNAESISQRMLETLCAQLQCKGILLLGEIVEGEEGEEGEVFISMVQHGALAKHPEIDFSK